MEIKKLVVLDRNEFNEEQKKELKSLAEEVVIYDDMPKDEEEASKRINDADVLIVCWYELSEKCVGSCPSVKYLGVVATGYDWLAAEYASKKGIIVTNVPNYATEAVSNYVFKQLEQYDTKDKTLGVIGLGNIGTRVAEVGKSKNLNILYWDRTFKKTDFQAAEFEEIFKKSDIITLHLKLNSETEKIIKNKHLDLIKENAIIVNTVSPKLFEDVDYLIQTIDSKNIKLILDFDEDNKLSELSKTNKNITYTPHVAWKSKESTFNLHQVAIENLKAFKKGKIQNKL